MPKINVYLPDDLADAVRTAGLPVSAICQRALEAAVRRITAIRRLTLDSLSPAELGAALPSFTPRTVTAVNLAVKRTRASASPSVTSGDLLHGLLAEGANMGLQILGALEIDPAMISAPDTAEPATPDTPHASGTSGEDSGLRLSGPAASAIELAVTEATGMGHNYVGCEHLLLGLSAEPDGAAGQVLRDLGADPRTTRRAVMAALAGYAHLRAATKPEATGLLTAMRAELAPLVQRIEALESRLS